MISKYKEFLLKFYEKIKCSLVNKCNAKIEIFSLVNDILTFISKYNNKYKRKLDFNVIIQSSDEELELVNKSADYLL
jgi:hypothetical protein